ncbi:MAG: thioredoxin-like domain-containing protein [Ferruginibacter sp.]
MQKLKYFSLLLSILSFNNLSFAQSFSFLCSHSQGNIPIAYYYNLEKNIYQESIFENKAPFKKLNDTSSLLSLNPLVVSFMQINGDDIIVSPNDKNHGHLDQQNLHISIDDSLGSNYLFNKIGSGITRIIVEYKVGSSFVEFKNTFLLLNSFIDSSTLALNNMLYQKKYSIPVIAAMKEYLMIRLAHFSVLPVLFQNDFDRVALMKIIEKAITIKDPRFWLQTQAGHIFLKTYYSKLLLPKCNFNYNTSISNKYLLDSKLRKYITYFYFDECIGNAFSPHSSSALLNDLKNLKASIRFTPDEQEVLNELSARIKLMGLSIMNDFTSQALENPSGKRLSLEEKKSIIGGSNIILDYWASWCAPCREKMNQRKNNLVTIGTKNYKIIYVSIDDNHLSWAKAKYPYLNDSNYFRLIDNGKNLFVKKYNIGTVPRYILVDQYKLISENFSY